MQALRGVYDPEIPVNVYDLGLIYEVEATPGEGFSSGTGEDQHEDQGEDQVVAHIRMTLTAPNCPMADMLLEQVRGRVGEVEGVGRVEVQLTFDPPWDRSLMSPEALLELGMM